MLELSKHEKMYSVTSCNFRFHVLSMLPIQLRLLIWMQKLSCW